MLASLAGVVGHFWGLDNVHVFICVQMSLFSVSVQQGHRVAVSGIGVLAVTDMLVPSQVSSQLSGTAFLFLNTEICRWIPCGLGCALK